MRKMKIIICFLLIMMFAFTAISCSNNQSNDINNTNLGLYYNAFQKHNGWIYYIDFMESANLYRVRPNGKDKMQIGDDSIFSFKVYGDRIYYIDSSEWYLYSIKIDGSDKKIITHSEYEGIVVSKMEISDDWIYAQLGTRIQLWKIKIDGSEFIELDDRIMDFCVDGEWIYYFARVPLEEAWGSPWGSQLWRMRTDGTQKHQLMQDASYFIDYDDKWIYYVDSESKSINKVGFDGKEKQTIVDCGNWVPLKVIGDWIFYSESGESPGIYKIKTDGSERTKISDDTLILFMDIWDNWLICAGPEIIAVIRVSNSYETDEIIMEIISDWPEVKIYE